MLSITEALNAWQHSRYNEVEHDLYRRIGGMSIPWVGDIPGSFYVWSNRVARWFKVPTAFLIGFDGDPKTVEETEIPEDLKATQLGKDLALLRDTKREIVDCYKNVWHHALRLQIPSAMRAWEAAKHQEIRAPRIVMPEDHEKEREERSKAQASLPEAPYHGLGGKAKAEFLQPKLA